MIKFHKIANKLKWGDKYKLIKSDPNQFLPKGIILTLSPINPHYEPYGNCWIGEYKGQVYQTHYNNIIDNIKCYKQIK